MARRILFGKFFPFMSMICRMKSESPQHLCRTALAGAHFRYPLLDLWRGLRFILARARRRTPLCRGSTGENGCAPCGRRLPMQRQGQAVGQQQGGRVGLDVWLLRWPAMEDVCTHVRHPVWLERAAAWTSPQGPNQFVTTTHDIGFQLMRSYGDGYCLRDCERIDLGIERRREAPDRRREGGTTSFGSVAKPSAPAFDLKTIFLY